MAKSNKSKTYISFTLISKRTFDFYGRLKLYKAFDIITTRDDWNFTWKKKIGFRENLISRITETHNFREN